MQRHETDDAVQDGSVVHEEKTRSPRQGEYDV